jgi:hypothetical protein
MTDRLYLRRIRKQFYHLPSIDREIPDELQRSYHVQINGSPACPFKSLQLHVLIKSLNE